MRCGDCFELCRKEWRVHLRDRHSGQIPNENDSSAGTAGAALNLESTVDFGIKGNHGRKERAPAVVRPRIDRLGLARLSGIFLVVQCVDHVCAIVS
jgi:hypothetical protein